MKKKRKAPDIQPTGHVCAAGGCKEPGDYKAPLSRYNTGQHQYLCLNHIREFNKAWDYFDGWGRDAIEEFMHDAAFGHRPTWKMGMQPQFTSDRLRDAFYKMLGEAPPEHLKKPAERIGRKERDALAALDLEPGAGLEVVKTQYKKLVKKYHPDVNASSQAEETFKHITAAYTYLCKTYGKNDEK